MKIRNSLVSNSSSASFICYWRCLNTIGDDPMDKDTAIKRLMNEYNDDDINIKEMTKDLLTNSMNTSSKGTFKTEGFTSMYNSVEDVPKYLAYLLVALKSEEGYELIDFRTEED